MTLVVGASAHGSPGVSTALQLIASSWIDTPLVPVVVEGDAGGGVLAARYEISLSPGFVTLAESLRKFETPPLLDHAQRLPSGIGCVALSPSAGAAGAQLRSAGPYLGPYLAQSHHPVLLDAGTVLPDSKLVPTMCAADLLLWFVRPTREELLVLRHRLAECPQPDDVAVVLVGSTPYDAAQVSDALDVEVLHALPVDRRGADAANLGGDDRYLRRCQLTRSCAELARLVSARTPGGGAGSHIVSRDALPGPSTSPPPPPPARSTSAGKPAEPADTADTAGATEATGAEAATEPAEATESVLAVGGSSAVGAQRLEHAAAFTADAGVAITSAAGDDSDTSASPVDRDPFTDPEPLPRQRQRPPTQRDAPAGPTAGSDPGVVVWVDDA